jgi:hypothetical protein
MGITDLYQSESYSKGCLRFKSEQVFSEICRIRKTNNHVNRGPDIEKASIEKVKNL